MNELYANNLRIPTVKSAEFDDNQDGKVDRLELNVAMPTRMGESIYGVSGIVYHNVQISNAARYKYDAMTYLNYESASAIEKLSMDGNLNIKQTWPFNPKGGWVRYR